MHDPTAISSRSTAYERLQTCREKGKGAASTATGVISPMVSPTGVSFVGVFLHDGNDTQNEVAGAVANRLQRDPKLFGSRRDDRASGGIACQTHDVSRHARLRGAGGTTLRRTPLLGLPLGFPLRL